MKVTIHFKNNKDPVQYNMNAEELRKLVDDFETYIQTGTPRKGMYDCQDEERGKSKSIFIDFQAISIIV